MSSPAPLSALPAPPATVHFIGIGGISMSGLASLMQAWGYTVTGSDASASATTERLQQDGVEIIIGHEDGKLAGKADLIVSTRRAELNAQAELAAAEENGAIILKRGQFVGLVAEQRRTFAVAGTHGKSTTSGMLTTALAHLDLHPSFVLGAVLPDYATTAAAGTGEAIVVEADEFDRSFLWLKPDIAIITSVSFDHPDIYDSQADYDAAFAQYAGQIRDGGSLVIAADDPGCQRVVDELQSSPDHSRIVTFGENDAARWRLANADGWTITSPDGISYPFSPKVVGRHNARNATAAIAALVSAGIPIEDAIRGVEQFTGVGRRFEHKGSFAGVDVVDDYAHHPDEINAVIRAARDTYPDRRLVVVHQPHTFSRTKLLLNEFAESLSNADQVVLLDIYPSSETDDLGVSSTQMQARISVPTLLVSGPVEAAAAVAELQEPGDVVLTLGAGDITMTAAMVIEDLKRKETASRPAVQRPARAQTTTIDLPGYPGLKAMEHASMSMFTTMRLGGPADFVIRAATPEAILAAQAWALNEGLPITVIGGGSNLLVSDEGVRGAVIVARTPGERATDLLEAENRGDHVLVKVAAQAPLSWVGRYCSEQGWSGMDWGVGLPGQIGGATVNNAGAHGTEMKDHLIGLDLLTADGQVHHVGRDWLSPTYRMTTIKGTTRPRPWLVLRSYLRLPKGDPVALVALADEHAAFRKRTQPTGACSGSTFTNPPGDFAGRLLEAAGMKGHKLGGMQISPKHANWVVNAGGGTANQAWELIRHAQDVVAKRFGILLHPEIERIGSFPDKA